MAVQDPMIPMPMKRPESLDWVKPMKNYIKQTLSAQEADNLAENWEHMNRLRKGINDTATDRDKPTESLVEQVIVPYVGLCQYANLHFPLTDSRIRISFQWHDISRRKKAVLPNINLEITACLFNAAITYHYLASNEDRGASEGIKSAFKHFQTAAGYLELVKEKVALLSERLTTDLTTDGLAMFSQLMLTSAHHCSYLKAALEMKDKRLILSKLAMEGANMYEDLRRQMSHPSLSESVDKSWLTYTELYQHVFTARAWVHLAGEFHHKDEIGKEIGHLNVAVASLNTAANLARGMRHPGFPQFVAGLQEEVRKLMDRAVSDNEKVYHDRVPSADALTPPVRLGKTTAKPAALGSVKELVSHCKDPFSHVTPVHILDAQMNFKDSIGAEVTSKSNEIKQHRDKMRDTINQMGVHGAIAAFEKGATGLPATMWDRIQKIKTGDAGAHGGCAAFLTDTQTTLRNLAESVRNTNNSLISQLQEEEDNDRNLREKFKGKWSREESNRLNGDLKKLLNDFRAKINAATSGDKIIEGKLQQHWEDIVKLDLQKEQLDAMLPGAGCDEDDGQAGAVVAKMKHSLGQMEEKENVETVMLQELQDMYAAGDKDLSIELAAAGKDGEDTVLAAQRKKYDEKIQELIANQVRSDNILNDMITLVTQLSEIRSKNASENRREIVINRLDNSINKYLEIVDNMKEGCRFYQTTLDVTEKHKGKVEDFVFARNVQKDELLTAIQREAAHIETTNELMANLQQLEQEQAAIQQQVKQKTQEQHSGSYQQPSSQQPSWQQQPPQYSNQPPPGGQQWQQPTQSNYPQYQPPPAGQGSSSYQPPPNNNPPYQNQYQQYGQQNNQNQPYGQQQQPPYAQPPQQYNAYTQSQPQQPWQSQPQQQQGQQQQYGYPPPPNANPSYQPQP